MVVILKHLLVIKSRKIVYYIILSLLKQQTIRKYLITLINALSSYIAPRRVSMRDRPLPATPPSQTPSSPGSGGQQPSPQVQQNQAAALQLQQYRQRLQQMHQQLSQGQQQLKEFQKSPQENQQKVSI